MDNFRYLCLSLLVCPVELLHSLLAHRYLTREIRGAIHQKKHGGSPDPLTMLGRQSRSFCISSSSVGPNAKKSPLSVGELHARCYLIGHSRIFAAIFAASREEFPFDCTLHRLSTVLQMSRYYGDRTHEKARVTYVTMVAEQQVRVGWLTHVVRAVRKAGNVSTRRFPYRHRRSTHK